MRRILSGGSLLVLMAALPGPAAALSAMSDTSRVSLAVGPAFEAHLDRLASPFRESGTGVGWAGAYRNGGFFVNVEYGAAPTSAALAATGAEDTWSGALEVGYVRRVAGGGRTSFRAGATVAGMVFARRHTYGAGTREYYADLMVPVSAVGEAEHRLGTGTRVLDRLSLGAGAILFRSPFYSTKELPDATVVGPGTLRLARNHLALERALSPRTRVTVDHALTIYDADRHRAVRVVHQELRVGLALLFGGGAS